MQVVDRAARERRWSAAVARHPDRALLCVCFAGFGIWSAVITLTTTPFAGLSVLFLLLDLEFIAVGVLGLMGMSPRFRKVNAPTQIIIAAAMLMLGLVLLFMTRSPFALLAFGFAFQGLFLGRVLRAQDQVVGRVSAVVEQDSGHVEGPPPGGETGLRRPNRDNAPGTERASTEAGRLLPAHHEPSTQLP